MGKGLEPTHPDIPANAAGEEDRVKGTTIHFGDFRVRKFRGENHTILEFSGIAREGLGRNLERLVAQSRGDVGIDLSEVEGLTPALVPVLERVRKRLLETRHSLFLCNPPSKLIDALTLGGVVASYTIVSSSGDVPLALPPTGLPPARGPRGGVPPSAGPAEVTAHQHAVREIAYFDRSLKRTEVLERGLDSAARCIQKTLPSRPPVVPGYRFAFTYRQSEKVGGDFFDFIPLAGGCLGISVGDMSGRGLEAAVLMCLAKKVISIRARDGSERIPALPREVLSRANEDLRGDLDRSAFITAIYAVLDPRAGLLRFARAGHERPVWFLPGSGAEPRALASEGAALGVAAGEQFRTRLQEYVVEMQPGSRLLLFTDGLIDAQSGRGQSFSRARLLDGLRRARSSQTPEEILASLFEEISRHTGGVPPEDDMTAVLIARD